MKIAVTTKAASPDSAMDERFGRAAKFAIYDTEKKEYSFHDNTRNLQAAQGAGIQTAGNVVCLGCEALLTGHCGPKAYAVLRKSGVQVYCVNNKSVAVAVEDFLSGRLAALTAADVEGHW
ncbi:MAG: NifB/NifX family molybdenum-iron cluster-binding protein [Fibrobacterota bacterium]